MDQARRSTGWLRVSISKRQPVGLLTTVSVEEELFAALEYYSENPVVGSEFLASRKTPHPARTFSLFKSFVRQGKTFFEAGSKLHFRASALMYYYSFLNLAKAYISLSDPSFVKSFVGHGLSLGRFREKPISRQSVYSTYNDGVFHKFYELETHTQFPKDFSISLRTLLGYCSDIKVEYEQAKYGRSRVLPVKARFFSHQAQRASWPMLAVLEFEKLRPYKKALIPFWEYFKQVEPDPSVIRRTFDLGFPGFSYYSFFESKQVYEWTPEGNADTGIIQTDMHQACQNLFESPIYDDGNDGKLVLPLRLNHQLLMNQPIAIYILMFFVGSLVRYRPDFLENLLSSTDAWLIERFVRSSTTTFLRYVANAILGTDFLYTQR